MKFLNIILIVSWTLLVACSFEVKKASAPTNPPKIEKSIFSAASLNGVFEQSATPKMFLWPTEKLDEVTQKFLPMSFEEQVTSRQEIARAADDLDLISGNKRIAQNQLDEKYAVLKVDLWNQWTADKCYTMCDEFAVFCSPDNEETEEIDDDEWKEAETPEEEVLIASCQENQSRRKNIDSDKKSEEAEVVDPLLKQEEAATKALLLAVDEKRNFFQDMARFKFHYGAFRCSAADNKCEENQGGETKLYIRINYGDHRITNYEDNESEYFVKDVDLDETNGFLQFTIPAFDFNNSTIQIGEIKFDLEFSTNQFGELAVTGDIRRFDNRTNQEKIGRFSVSGTVE